MVEAGPHVDFGVEQSGGADDLLHHHAVGLAQFVVGGRGAHEEGLGREVFEFLEGERTVVHRRGQPEAVFDQRFLAGAVAAPHGPDLRHGDVAFVHDHQEILGEIVEQAEGPLTGQAFVEVARVVLDARAVAEFAHHLHVELGAFLDALGFQQSALAGKIADSGDEVVLDHLDGIHQHVAARDEEVGGENGDFLFAG